MTMLSLPKKYSTVVHKHHQFTYFTGLWRCRIKSAILLRESALKRIAMANAMHSENCRGRGHYAHCALNAHASLLTGIVKKVKAKLLCSNISLRRMHGR